MLLCLFDVPLHLPFKLVNDKASFIIHFFYLLIFYLLIMKDRLKLTNNKEKD
jgi:hypothetical protein